MRSQKQLRDELRFVSEFNTLFDVVQQTAVTQTRHLEDKVGRMRTLSGIIEQDFIPMLPDAASSHPYVRGGEKGRLLVVITSDEGLVGPLHSNVIDEAKRRVTDGVSWLFIGQRGFRMASGQELTGEVQAINMPPEERADEQLARVQQFIFNQYRALHLKDVWVIAPKYISMTHQIVFAQQLLPLPVDEKRLLDKQVVIEPALTPVIERLAQAWVTAVLSDSFWPARRAECAARAMHVEASRQELSRYNRRVRYALFKAQHERVDVMVRETCVVQRFVSGRNQRRTAAARKAGIA